MGLTYSITPLAYDDPYGDIRIKHGSTTVVKLPLDDAPVHDFNDAQRVLARRIVDFLNSQQEA